LARQSTPDEACPIRFQVANMAAEKTSSELCEKFDVLLDKGTWDAMSLAEDQSRMLVNYRRTIEDLFDLKSDLKDQLFVIISCNFTV
jgi:hypothetical protein